MKTPLIRKNTCKEIVVSHFGMQRALASYDVMGNVSFFRIDIDAQLFIEKMGQGVIASIIKDDLWFDISQANGVYFGRSPQTDFIVQAFESEPGTDTDSSRFVSYSYLDRVILRHPKRERRLLSSENLSELALLAEGFALSFKKLIRPRSQAAVDSPPFIILPKTRDREGRDFSRDLVLVQ